VLVKAELASATDTDQFSRKAAKTQREDNSTADERRFTLIKQNQNSRNRRRQGYVGQERTQGTQK
jgi:hypothetical protein